MRWEEDDDKPLAKTNVCGKGRGRSSRSQQRILGRMADGRGRPGQRRARERWRWKEGPAVQMPGNVPDATGGVLRRECPGRSGQCD